MWIHLKKKKKNLPIAAEISCSLEMKIEKISKALASVEPGDVKDTELICECD